MTSGFIRGAAKALAKNGKKAAKAVVKNGDNGNGLLRNGAEALTEGNLAKQAFVDKTAAQRLNATKATEWIEAGVAGQPIPPSTNYVQQQVRNRYRPGAGPLRANRPTSKTPAHSTIFSESVSMKQAYPNEWESIKGEVESWVRGGYAWARNKKVGTLEQPLKNYGQFEGPDGKLWRLKSKAKFGQGYRLSTIDTKKLQGYGAKRSSRENPWTNEDEMQKLLRALAKYGKAHKFADLIQIMRSDFDKGMAAIPKGYSKGHLVSLDDGGIDVAENFVPQLLKNTRQKIDGKWTVIKGNAAMKADSTDLLVGQGISNWDDYVRLKLSQL